MNAKDLENLSLSADYHTHTVFSHGTGTIEENVQAAVKLGMNAIGITDHGFRHMMFAVTPAKLQVMRAETERLKKLYAIEILLGIEANIVNHNGDLDLTEEEAAQLDFVCFGAHYTAKPYKFSQFLKFNVHNLFRLFQGKRQRAKNTRAYIEVIKRYKPKFITHMNYVARVNCGEVAKAAAEYGTLIELNGKRVFFSKAEIKDILDAGANFVINSDAHSASRVGEFNKVREFLKTVDIPKDRIVNLK